MALGSRSWRALMWRNSVYRKRHFITSGSEVLIPIAFLGIVIALKNAAKIEDDDIVSAVRSVGFYEDISSFVALLLTLGILFPTATMIRYIVAEKEQRQKELLKMMNTTEADIGWAWFTSFFLFHILTCMLLAVISMQLYAQAELSLVFLFWILSFASFIVVAMLVAALFSKTSRATFVGLLVFFFGYFATLAEEYETSTNLRVICLHPMAAFSYGFREIGRLEDGRGLSFDSMNTTTYENHFTFSIILQSLFLDCLLYGFLTYYFNRVIPPSYGQPEPLYFPFVPSYWCPSSSRRNRVDTAGVEAAYDPNIPVESVSDTMRMQAREGKSIEIHNLKKAFQDKIAVDGLNLSIYNGQILSLLGHNGAGKTTTINILIGALAPTEGTAVIAGKDIHSSMHLIRQSMGVCLQHDCIFKSLTVREHIILFSSIKGVYATLPSKEAEERVDQALEDVGLSDKKYSLAVTLSGGMKRKLNLAMAFCGGSRIVILDEPTSGMDPFTRRLTWDLIRKYRENRTVLLTTHHMDEAEALGDRVAIMANGKLRCCGGSLFLKKQYGVGYQLTIEKHQAFASTHHRLGTSLSGIEEGDVAFSKSHDEVVMQLVHRSVSEATLLSNAAGEMKFQLPISASAKFVPMLKQLDDQISRGIIDSYGLGFTTLEEVFILVSRSDAQDGSMRAPLSMSEQISRSRTALTNEDFKGEKLFLRHIRCLFVKRALNFKRDRKAWFLTTILPSFMVFMGFLFNESLDVFAIWFLVTLSFPFITGTFGSFVVSEKHNKSRHLQTIAGVTPAAYWVSTFLWDVLNYQFTMWITVIFMFAFDTPLARSNVVSGVITILLAFGPASASFTYCLSFLFSSPAFCTVLNIVMGFLIGFGGTIVVFLLWFFGNGWNTQDDDFTAPLEHNDKLLFAAKAMTWSFRFFPAFCLSNGLFNAIQISDENRSIKGGGVSSVWDSDVLLFEVVLLVFEAVFYLFVAVQIDKIQNDPKSMMKLSSVFQKVTCASLPFPETGVTHPAAHDDNDVVREEQRVNLGEADSDLLVIKNLTKRYMNGKLAVDRVCLGIPHGECFGLLGVNGAGKTTMFSMLTTDSQVPPTSGTALLDNFNITEQPYEARTRIGYCPQFDALFPNMTGREHVELYALIKGASRKHVKSSAVAILEAVGLNDYDANRLASQYSGGMKRKLSLACGTIGQPRLILLDEPTTGVDPVGKREVWKLIENMLTDSTVDEDERPSVFLTTHSMEECEALCSRIGIMADGKLRCLGSAQHLKTKFGRGYQVELNLTIPKTEDDDFVNALLVLGRNQPCMSDSSIMTNSTEVFFSHQEAISALTPLSGDDSLSMPFKNNSHDSMISLAQLAHFATIHKRKKKIEQFVGETFPNAALREQQDTKLRYEVNSAGLSIADIFAGIEANKEELLLADYGVSQTTLEQVFNQHAAEAERAKTNP